MADSRDTAEGPTSKALACATAIRAGGALYILAEATGLEEAYYGADAGIQAGMIALTRQREVKHDIICSAIDDCSSLSTRYPETTAAAAFFGAGILVIRMVLVLIGEDRSDVSLQRINDKAREAARLWPTAIDAGAQSSLVEFEAACQNTAVEVLGHGGARALREEAGKHALVYRRAAQALR
ncbi:hypothetical protein SAMN05216223_11699 [Actinacidiphila yanglinensis]|uniref:Uncharacterized protein n=1 Tax=Actinacidiphila yanglinensis TaxID=310779 RepID=A0A1H6DL66_9ACTN|nr:hypothetical protein [Actinacidiphila yanglinensis]SEG85583.1 hypothetical protein SAMN05216223_11699 [Actinacidiphila yanglinensis]